MVAVSRALSVALNLQPSHIWTPHSPLLWKLLARERSSLSLPESAERNSVSVGESMRAPKKGISSIY